MFPVHKNSGSVIVIHKATRGCSEKRSSVKLALPIQKGKHAITHTKTIFPFKHIMESHVVVYKSNFKETGLL